MEHLRRGRAALERGDAALAVRELEATVELRPTMPAPWKELGRAQLALGHEREAIQAFRHYLVVAPQAGDAPAVRSRLLQLGVRE